MRTRRSTSSETSNPVYVRSQIRRSSQPEGFLTENSESRRPRRRRARAARRKTGCCEKAASEVVVCWNTSTLSHVSNTRISLPRYDVRWTPTGDRRLLVRALVEPRRVWPNGSQGLVDRSRGSSSAGTVASSLNAPTSRMRTTSSGVSGAGKSVAGKRRLKNEVDQ